MDKFEIVVLVRKNQKEMKIIEAYSEDIEIVWGDLTHYEDVKKSLENVDVILHLAALVSLWRIRTQN